MTDVMHPNASDLAAAQCGDQQAFARLYDGHAPVVLSLCRMRRRSDAEDACQETFIRAFRNLHKVDGPQHFRAWLYSIAKRVCSEQRRSDMRRTHHVEQATMIAQTNLTARSTDGHVECMQREDQLGRLTDAINTLPERERLAIHLHYLEADPVTIARDILGLSRSGYYKLLSRARDLLASAMKQHAETESTFTGDPQVSTP